MFQQHIVVPIRLHQAQLEQEVALQVHRGQEQNHAHRGLMTEHPAHQEAVEVRQRLHQEEVPEAAEAVRQLLEKEEDNHPVYSDYEIPYPNSGAIVLRYRIVFFTGLP